jgi:hypothetical protein
MGTWDSIVPGARAEGHEQYKVWLNAVGSCFSPFFPSQQVLRFGPWSSWTTEGLYLGLKLLVIGDCSLIDPLVEFELFRRGVPSLVHVPAVMAARDDLVHQGAFQLLKSGRKYNAIRNRCFGRLNRGEANWAWSGTWRHPILNVPVPREQFERDVFGPALFLSLSQHGTEVARLKAFWGNGQHRISDKMRLAHGHLRYVEEYVRQA